MADCKECKYRQWLANAYDIHIDEKDCDKANTYFCMKMHRKEVVVIIDAGCTDKTIYAKGYADGKRDAVVHGRWEAVEDFDGEYHWKCSACGIEWWFEVGGPVENGSHYCPNCGADMRERENDGTIQNRDGNPVGGSGSSSSCVPGCGMGEDLQRCEGG